MDDDHGQHYEEANSPELVAQLLRDANIEALALGGGVDGVDSDADNSDAVSTNSVGEARRVAKEATSSLDEGDDDDVCQQSFNAPGYQFFARYQKARNGHWVSLNCTDSVVQRFHPSLLAGMRVLTTSTAQALPSAKVPSPQRRRRGRQGLTESETEQPAVKLVPSIVIGIADGFLWRFEDGASGVTSFAATSREHLDQCYHLVIPKYGKRQQPQRSTVRNIAAVPDDECDAMSQVEAAAASATKASSSSDLKAATTVAAASGAGVNNAQNTPPAAVMRYDHPPFHAASKRERTWFPTRTGNSWFDYTHDEDADVDICSFVLRQKTDLKSAMFGHKKQPFLFYAPISGREASRGADVRPLFPMMCEYDISPASLSPFKVKRGDALMVHKGNRSGHVMFVVGTLHGRLVLFEEGAFPVECDPSFSFASLQTTIIEGPGNETFCRPLDSVDFAFPLRQADDGGTTEGVDTAKTATNSAKKTNQSSLSKRQRPQAQQAADNETGGGEPCPPTLTCCSRTFECSASRMFYQYGWFPLCRVAHRKGPRRGTTGVVLGIELSTPSSPRKSIRAASSSVVTTLGGAVLWEYNEAYGACFPFEGSDKHSVDQHHMLELIGFRSTPLPTAVPPRMMPSKHSSSLGATGNSRKIVSHMATKVNGGASHNDGSDAPPPPPSYVPLAEAPHFRFMWDSTSIKAIDSATPVHPWRCCWSSAMSGPAVTGQGNGNAASAHLDKSSTMLGRTAPVVDSPFGSLTNYPATFMTSSFTPRKSLASRQQQRRGATHDGSLLLLDTRWSSLIPHGLGVHGSVVQVVSGVQYGRLGILLGVHGGDAYILWNQEVGAVRVTSSLRQRIRWMPSMAPRPVMFPTPHIPHALLLVGAASDPSAASVAPHRSHHGGAVTSCMDGVLNSAWWTIKPAVNGMLIGVDISWQATWRFGVVHGQQIVFCPRSQLSSVGSDELALDPIGALRLPNKEAFGWRVGTVAGTFHTELFLYMHDVQLLEPLTGRCEGELLMHYCFVVFGPPSSVNLRTTQDLLLDTGHACSGAASMERDVPLPLPEMTHLQLYTVRTLAEAPLPLNDASLSPRSLQQQKEQLLSKPCTALVDISLKACQSVMLVLEEGGGAVRLGSVSHGARLRQQIRIEPVRISRQRWRSFASDHWCTIIGLVDGRVMACVDDDTRFLVPLSDDYTAELVDPKQTTTYISAPKLPAVTSSAFRCAMTLEEALNAWQDVLRQVAALDATDGQRRGGGGRSAQGTLKKIQSAQMWQQNPLPGAQDSMDGEPVAYDAIGPRPQCDDAIVRSMDISEAQTREARMLCQMLPEEQLVDILQWVLELHGVHLRDGESMTTALRLLAGVRLTTVVGNEHPVPEERYSCDLPSTAQWCQHQRERLVDAEVGNREYAASQEKMEREKLMFDERTRYERLKSIFDEDDDDGGNHNGVDRLNDNTHPLHNRPASAGGFSRASSFASTGSRRLSRKPTNNLKQIFANKWRRSLDTEVLNSVVSAAFLPGTMRQRIFAGTGASHYGQRGVDSSAPSDSPASYSPALGSPTSARGSGYGGPRGASSASKLRSAESMTMTTIRLLEEARQRTAVPHSDSDEDEEAKRHSNDDDDASRGGPVDTEQVRKRQQAAESRAIAVLEQLSTFPSWPLRYTLHTGIHLTLDISLKACEAFGLYHGQQYEVTRGDLAGETITILGVYRRQLWRYSTTAEAMPFEGSTGSTIVAQHGLQLVTKHNSNNNNNTAHQQTDSLATSFSHSVGGASESRACPLVRRCDPFFFPTFPNGEFLRLDVSDTATFEFGVLVGQRYLVTGKRSRQNFLPIATPPATGSPPAGAAPLDNTTSGASYDPSVPPTIVVLGVCKNQKLWVAPVESHGGTDGNGWARSYHRGGSSSRSIHEDWGLVFLYTAPVTVPKSMLDAMLQSIAGDGGKLKSPHSTPSVASLQLPPSPSSAAGAVHPPASPLVDLALYRERKHFRFRNGLGEVLLFDVSAPATATFGVRFGDRILFRKPAKLCGRICVILGVREKKLWKVDERDTVATVLPKCKCAADLHNEYGIKVSGHQVIREFIG